MLARLRVHLLVGVVLSALVFSGGQAWLREALIDLRYGFLTRPASGEIALVAIDPTAIDSVGRWPWPRSVHAELLRSLDQAGANEVVFDVDFSSPSNAADDAAFAAALEAVGGSTVLAAFRQRQGDRAQDGRFFVNRPIAAFASHAWLGLVNVVPDRDGVIRRYPFGARIGEEFVPSIGSLLANRLDETSPSFRVDFGIQAQTVPLVSAADVLKRDAQALALIRGKRVIVAGTATELGDRFLTPGGRILPGGMVQVLAAESILQGRALSSTSRPASLALGLLVAIAAFLSWRRLRGGTLAACAIAVAVAAEGIATLAQAFWPIAIDTSLIVAAGLTYSLAALLHEIDLRGLMRVVAERRFDRITMSLRDGLVCTDDRGLIRVWNDGARTIFGYTADQIVGQPFETLLQPSGAPFRLTALPRQSLQQDNGVLVELKGVRQSGAIFDLECSLSSWEGADGLHYGAVLRDISERKSQQDRIRFLAECDPISGLPNRNALLVQLERAFEDGDRSAANLLLLSIDRFAQMTQLHGASTADAIVAAVAERLQQTCPDAATIARLGIDEFAILAPSLEHAQTMAAKIEQAFASAPIGLGKSAHRISVSIGIASTADASGAEQWLGNAQFALTAAKAADSGVFATYVPAMRAAIVRREALEVELRLALQREQFELFYQPQIDFRSGQIVGAEALIRWRHPERGLVSPGEFLPVVNTTSLSESVAAWVLATACRQASRWHTRGTPVRVGINLTQSQFAVGDLVADIRTLLREFDLPPELIELEVTEDIILESASAAQAVLGALRAMGVKIAFDDFGTGYGSLTHLKAFPLDTIKIDQTFVRNLVPGSDDAAIVRATINLGQSLGLSVIAEGIETKEVAELLAQEGCDEGQGYLIGKPIPAAEFEERFLATKQTIAA